LDSEHSSQSYRGAGKPYLWLDSEPSSPSYRGAGKPYLWLDSEPLSPSYRGAGKPYLWLNSEPSEAIFAYDWPQIYKLKKDKLYPSNYKRYEERIII